MVCCQYVRADEDGHLGNEEQKGFVLGIEDGLITVRFDFFDTVCGKTPVSSLYC